MSAHFCKKHPATPASFKCYHCREHICTTCRKHLDHHYFCGYGCFVKYKLNHLLGSVESHGFRLLLIFQLVIILVFLWAFLHFQKQFKSLPVSSISTKYQENEYFDQLKDLLISDNFTFMERHFFLLFDNTPGYHE